MTSLLPILLLAFIVTAFGAGILYLSSLLGPKRNPTPAKMMPYECGVPGTDRNDSKISVKFYLTAILFIIFDIEIIFMYPWAVAFMDFVRKGQGMYILIGMGVFILLFVIGLFWEVKSKALEWD
jgi:NADH-quinone oxidoreductase subunit A